MFRRDHQDEELATRIDHLMTSIVLRDDEDRLDGVMAHVAPDVVYVGPWAVFDGPVGLSEAFERLRRADRQPASLRRTSGVDCHHHYFRFSWERLERGAVVVSGWIFGSLDESGAIDRFVVFEGLEPGQSGDRHEGP
ncbi:MAG TPA: hypothetical protein VGF51_08580 [Acidimicrobiales bacterium]|jgi:hypothetical protein